MKSLMLTALLLTCTIGCGGASDSGDASEAAPETTIRAMRALAEAGDWDAYVDRYYGETHKFSSPADRDALVGRFEQTWGAQVLEALQKAESLEPRIDGDRAFFEDSDGQAVFELRRSAEGTWTFHL